MIHSQRALCIASWVKALAQKLALGLRTCFSLAVETFLGKFYEGLFCLKCELPLE